MKTWNSRCIKKKNNETFVDIEIVHIIANDMLIPKAIWTDYHEMLKKLKILRIITIFNSIDPIFAKKLCIKRSHPHERKKICLQKCLNHQLMDNTIGITHEHWNHRLIMEYVRCMKDSTWEHNYTNCTKYIRWRRQGPKPEIAPAFSFAPMIPTSQWQFKQMCCTSKCLSI